MKTLFKQIPLYRYLSLCDDNGLEKTVLDCGAGGDSPPLCLFAHHGYTTQGLDLDPKQVSLANAFGASQGHDLQIALGDMCKLPFVDNSISYVYAYNTIFHMRKTEVAAAFREMVRVTRPGGLLFVNFLTTKDFRCGEGGDLGDNQYEQFDDDEPVVHSYYAAMEPEPLFEGLEIVFKEDRVVERMYEGEWICQGFVDYIVRKPRG